MKFNQFQSGFRRLIFPLGILVVFGLTLVSCFNDDEASPKQSGVTQEQREALEQFLKKMPAFELQTESGQVYRVEKNAAGGWSFTNPPTEPGYAESSTGTYTFVENTSAGGTFAVAASGFGSNSSGGGIISAGSNTYDFKYTFCLSADEEALDLGLFDEPFDGVSMVIGISGEFEKILEGEVDADDTSFEDLFSAFGYFIVYDDQASGSYEVIGVTESEEMDENQLNGQGLAFIFDIKNGKFFLSKDGNLTVSGGNIGFNGNYFEIDAAWDAADNELDAAEMKVVSGIGSLGCN